ncbi:MAG: hypothetical protein R2771_05430 [Saprospiraceae bacterium]
MGINVNKIIIAIFIGSIFILMNSCKKNSNIKYWKNENNTLIVEQNDTFFLYFIGYLQKIGFQKLDIGKPKKAKLISGDFEYNIFFKLPMEMDRIDSSSIHYKYLNDSLFIKNTDNDSLYKFKRINNLVAWDSLQLKAFHNGKQYFDKTINKNDNIDINVFSNYLDIGVKDYYTPDTSEDLEYWFSLYLSNGDMITEKLTYIPYVIGEYFFEGNNSKKNRKK